MTAARRMLAVAQVVLRAVGRPLVLGGLLVGGLGAGPVAAQTEVIEYYGQDALGSIRVVFDVTGVATARADFEPFGELFTVPGMPGGPLPAEQFTGQVRDPEASADYFGARFYTPRTGRFSQVDPVYAGLFDPQQWNRYAYVRNNPLSFIDPDGRAAKSREDFPCSYILSINSKDSPCTFLMGGGGLSSAASTGTDMRSGGPNGGGSGKGGNHERGNISENQKHLPSIYAPPGSEVDDFVVGVLDELTFGLTSEVLEVLEVPVDTCSSGYTAGGWVGFVGGIVGTAGAGLLKSGFKQAGKEFSHWVPARMGGVRALWNGNYVSPARHFGHDNFRYPSGHQDMGPRLPGPLQQFDRIPDAFKGPAAVGASSAASTPKC